MLYDYIENGVAENELTKRIDGAVREARTVEKWRAEYMFYDINLMDAKEEGIEEGRKEGRAEERKNTEAAVKRAEKAEELLKKYQAKYGDVI